jgi:hypothetical protein
MSSPFDQAVQQLQVAALELVQAQFVWRNDGSRLESCALCGARQMWGEIERTWHAEDCKVGAVLSANRRVRQCAPAVVWNSDRFLDANPNFAANVERAKELLDSIVAYSRGGVMTHDQAARMVAERNDFGGAAR